MKNKIRRLLSLFFILLGFTPLLVVVCFDIQQEIIRNEMKEKLEMEQLQTIVVSEDKIIWMDEHEIWINDRLFDVHTYTVANGLYSLTGLYDEEETELTKRSSDITGKKGEENKLFSNYLEWLQFTCDHHEGYLLVPQLPSTHINFFNASSCIQLFKKVPTPPPRSTESVFG